MTAAPFSEVVSSETWRTEAERWIRERVNDAGAAVVGDVTQPRVRPWSTQLVVPTDAGLLWFKANCPALAFEPALHATLARLEPDEVDEPFAVDAERGWIVTRDRGSTLADSRESTLADWHALLRAAARMQRRLASRGPELLAAGLPDSAPHTVPARFEGLIESLAALPREHPSHLDASAARRLRGVRSLLDDSVATLLGGPLPTASFQHGDLHPGNVFAVAGGLRVFDFGDAQWAHPLETLAVPWGWIDRLSTVPWRPVVEAYASCWLEVIGPAELVRLLPSAMVTQVVNRSSTWWGAVARATAEELVEWGDSPRYFLELVLDDFTVPEA
jgi:hypothetical protein